MGGNGRGAYFEAGRYGDNALIAVQQKAARVAPDGFGKLV